MGRSRPLTPSVSLREAAKILKVSWMQVRAWGARGLLERSWEGKELRFRLDEVEGLARLLPRGGPADLGTFVARAELAYAKALTVERRIDDLYDLIGANRNTLDLREFAVRALHQSVEEALLETDLPTIQDVRDWAGTFFAMDEAYLLLVEEYVGTKEPWKKLLDLGYKLILEAPFDTFDDSPDLRTAYGYFNAARTQLRSVAYFYCRNRRSAHVADKLFGQQTRATDRIMGLLYPH